MILFQLFCFCDVIRLGLGLGIIAIFKEIKFCVGLVQSSSRPVVLNYRISQSKPEQHRVTLSETEQAIDQSENYNKTTCIYSSNFILYNKVEKSKRLILLYLLLIFF